MKKPLSVIAKEFGVSFKSAQALFSGEEIAGRSHSKYEVPMYDEDTINQVAIDSKNFQYFEWYCDNCGAHLNHQFGFVQNNGTWKCECCGYENDIDEDNLEL